MATIQDSKLDLLLTPRVPRGLAAAVESLTREVIRHQPENIYTFAANHFEKLLRLREQYGNNDTAKKKSTKLQLDTSETIRKRHIQLETKERRNSERYNRWSLNETANVLEKHRSIFGEEGKKISTAEIRKLASRSISMPSKLQYTPPTKKYETHTTDKTRNRPDKYATAMSSRRRVPLHYHSPDLSNACRSDSRSAPKIIPQIPLVKDIKTELKKNRISSRERKKTVEEKRMQVSCEYIKETTIERAFKKSVEKTKKIFETQIEQNMNTYSGSSIRRKPNVANKMDSPKIKKPSRTPKMDGIRNYVVQNLIGMSRLDELQTPSYVEKVQEVIDETSMIVKEKIEALKTGVIKAAKAKQLKSEKSSSKDEYFNILRKSSDSDNKNTDRHLFDTSSYQNTSRNSNYSNVIQDNSDLSESLDNVLLPVVRPPSSKSTSRSLSSRSDSDDLILPPISPESSKSTKVIEELVLPVLSPPHSASITPDSINSNEKIDAKSTINEVFQDSLNGTPDLLDEKQRSDSLGISDIADNSKRPPETLKSKLLEVEKVQRRIEHVLDDTASNESKDEIKESNEINVRLKIQGKLLEIQESEKRIEKILDYQATSVGQTEVVNADIKSKLQELEDTEKRIESIFIDKEAANESEMTNNDNEQMNNHENSTKRDFDNDNNNTSMKNCDDNDLNINNAMFSEVDWNLSPHSYVLTEGSPYDIPDSVTTVIIPERSLTPDSDTLQIELADGKICSTPMSLKESDDSQMENCLDELQEKPKISINDAFGEVVNTADTDLSTIDVDFIRGIKCDIMAPHQELDLIKEERDKETEDGEIIDSEDERVLEVEETLEKNEVECASKEEIKKLTKNNNFPEETNSLSEAAHVEEYETDETKEISANIHGYAKNIEILENSSLDIDESTKVSIESSNEIKDTSNTTDQSSLPFDPVVPLVPELHLGSLPDLTISSLNMTDDEQKEEHKNDSENLNSSKIHVSSTDTDRKGNSSLDTDDVGEKSSTEGDIKATHTIKNSPPNIIDILKEDSSLESRRALSESIEDVENSEHFQEDESKTLRESLNYSELETIKNDQILNETYVIEKGSIVNDSNDQTEVEDSILAEDSNSCDFGGVNTYKVAETPLGPRDDTFGEIDRNEELGMPVSETQDSLLIDRFDKAEEASLTQLKSHLIEQDCPREIDTDTVDSLKVSNQCIDRLDNSDILMTTSTNNAVNDNLSEETNTVEEEKTFAANALDNNFKASEAIVVAEEVVKDVEDVVDEKDDRQINVSEVRRSKDASSTASNTLLSAVIRIQAGIRGYLTRCRLRRTFKRCSSTLDGVPSIEDSFPVDCPSGSTSSTSPSSHLLPNADDVTSSLQSTERKKLRREAAVQRTTLSLENIFANSQLQHTGEFHDCLALPIFDTRTFSFKPIKEEKREEAEVKSYISEVSKVSKVESPDPVVQGSNEQAPKENVILHRGSRNSTTSSRNVEQVLGKILAASATNLSAPSSLGQFVDVVVLPADSELMLQNRYLNFITSVEDVASDLFSGPLIVSNSPQSVIIEEITSLDEAKSKIFESAANEEGDETAVEDAADKASNVEHQESLSSEEKSRKCTSSNVIETTASQASDVKTEQFAENSVNCSEEGGSEVEALNVESCKEDEPMEEEASGTVADSGKAIRDENENDSKETASLNEASISMADESMSINIVEVLGLGDKDNGTFASNLLISSRDSQDNHLDGDERRSLATTMQSIGKSVEERAGKCEQSDDEKTGERVDVNGTTNKSPIERVSSLTEGENSSAGRIKEEFQ